MNTASRDVSFLKESVPLLADFAHNQLAELAHGSSVAVLQPGEVIVHAGDELRFLGVVLEGKIAASVPAADGPPHSLGELGPGETFGEMALVSGDSAVADFR